jgi:hypothetical protein
LTPVTDLGAIAQTRRPTRRRHLRLPGSLPAWPFQLLLAFLVAIVLVPFQTDTTTQDAAQYRLNLETGRYDSVEDGDKAALFASTVRLVASQLDVQDPLLALGIIICAMMLFAAMRMRLGLSGMLIFGLMLLMPPVTMNYTQVLRQGVGSALILNGLTIGFLPVSVGLLGLGALMHQSLQPFALMIIARKILIWLVSRMNHGPWPVRLLRWFDRATVLALPVLAIVTVTVGREALLGDTAVIYLTFEASNTKRVLVSVMLLVCAWFLSGRREMHLANFAVFITTFVAFILPFTFDFLRLQTLIMPYIVLAALTLRSRQQRLLIILICMAISIYVMPGSGLNQLF